MVEWEGGREGGKVGEVKGKWGKEQGEDKEKRGDKYS